MSAHKFTATPVQVAKRNKSEDDLLAVIRDVHVRLMALLDRPDFQAWVSESPDAVSGLQAAQTLLYELRAGRAIETGSVEIVTDPVKA